MVEPEVVEEAAVGRQRLRSHTRVGCPEMGGADGGNEALQRAGERPLRHVAANLAEPDAPVPPGKGAEAAVHQRLPQLPRLDVSRAVPLAGEGEHRVRPDPDVAGDLLREMDAEEREGRIWDRVDQASNEGASTRLQRVVPAPERHDLRGRRRAGHASDAVGVEAGARDDGAGRERARLGPELRGSAPRRDRKDLSTRSNRALKRSDVVGERARDAAEVDDAGRWGIERPEPRNVRLELSEAGFVDALHAGDAVLARALDERVEAAELVLTRCNDRLSTALVGDPLLVAVRVDVAAPSDAEPRLQRSGDVVDPRVHDAAVPCSLMRRDLRLLLEHEHAQVGVTQKRLARHREAENAAADDGEVGEARGGRRRHARCGRRVSPSDPVPVWSGDPALQNAINPACLALMADLILVTGGAGYVGSILVDNLLGRGYRVRALDALIHGSVPSLLLPWGNDRFEFVSGDVRDPEARAKALEGVDAVVHL